MVLLLLCFRLVTSALCRAAHRGLSKGQVFSRECLLIARAPPYISGHYPQLSGARLISSHLTAGRQVPTDSSQTSSRLPENQQQSIPNTPDCDKAANLSANRWLREKYFEYKETLTPRLTSKRDSVLIEIAIMAVFASDTCLGMICSPGSLRHLFHKSLRRTRVRRGDVISQAALIRNALALIFQ